MLVVRRSVRHSDREALQAIILYAQWCSSPKSENGLGGEVPSVGILGKERLDGEDKSGGNQTGGVL